MTKRRETRQRVLRMIDALAPGDSIPAERQLSDELGVSRLTLRAALDELVREGYLVRRRGAGTFVSEPKVLKGSDTISSFSEDMRHRGLVPASRTLHLETVPAGAQLGRILRVSPAEPVIVAKRLRLANDDPMAIEHLCVRASVVPGLSARDLERGSFYELLRDRYRLTIGGGTQTVEPTVTDGDESELLGVPLHSPALLFTRILRSTGDEVVEYTTSVYRGDRYKLVSELAGDS